MQGAMQGTTEGATQEWDNEQEIEDKNIKAAEEEESAAFSLKKGLQSLLGIGGDQDQDKVNEVDEGDKENEDAASTKNNAVKERDAPMADQDSLMAKKGKADVGNGGEDEDNCDVVDEVDQVEKEKTGKKDVDREALKAMRDALMAKKAAVAAAKDE